MNRSVAVVLALLGCSDYGFGDNAPQYAPPAARPIPVASQTDRIVQVTTPMVDILWMVDNSCSMSDDQRDLTENFPLFMNFFVGSGLDYHVGVTSSDIDGNYNGADGKLREVAGMRFLDPDTSSPIEVFEAMATMGTMGSGNEKGVGAIYQALEDHEDGANDGFYRDEASLHTVVISDEPDYTPPNVIGQEEFIGWYDGIKPEPDERSFSAIVDPTLGSRYRNIALQIGGISWNINDDGWDLVLEQLGIQAAGLKREYFLSQRPVLGTIVVSVEDVTGAKFEFEEGVFDPETGTLTDTDGDSLPDGDWYYEPVRNSISFTEFIPTPLATIVIEYTLLSAQQTAEEFDEG